MSYPSRPGPRIPYEENGTRVLISHTSGEDRTPYQVHPDAIAALNSDIGHGMWISDDWWNFGNPPEPYYAPNFIALIFPYPMTLTGFAAALQSDWSIQDGFFSFHSSVAKLTARLQVSTNTTNGLDGTWTTIETKDEVDEHLGISTSFVQVIGGSNGVYVPEPAVEPDGQVYQGPSLIGSPGSFFTTYYHFADSGRLLTDDGPGGAGTAPLSGATNVMGLRLFFPRRPVVIDQESIGATFRNALLALHLYGDKGTAVSDDRLEIRNNAGTGEPSFQWGDVYQGSEHIRSFRVKNTSSSDTALAVSVVLAPTTTDEQALPQVMGISDDGEVWASRVLIGNLAPGELSDELFIRLKPTTDTVGLRSALVVAQAGRWT